MEAIRIREYPVQPRLAPYVKCVWSLESDGPIHDAPRERILPDSCVELVFHFSDPFRSYFSNGESAIQPGSFVVGQMKQFIEIAPAGRAGFVAVRFLARGAYLFFQRPLSEVAAGVVDLDDLCRSRAREWTERVAQAPHSAARVRLVETLLLELLGNDGRTDPAVDRGLELIAASGGQIRMERLAAEIGVSGRHLARQFQRAVGLSPKEFARVTRFLCAVKLLDQCPERSLADVALACGFFDQAHFNHEFREMAGMSPGDLSTFPNVSF